MLFPSTISSSDLSQVTLYCSYCSPPETQLIKMFGYEMIFRSYIHHHFYIVATYCCTQNRLITVCNTDGSRTRTRQRMSQCAMYNNSFPLNLLNCSVGSTATTCHTIHFSYSLPCISITIRVTSFWILQPCVAL